MYHRAAVLLLERAAALPARATHDRGQSLVELALITPLLLLLLLILIDLGRAFSLRIAVANAAREGAFLASLRFAGDTTDDAIRTEAASESGGTAIRPDPTYVVVAYPSPDVVRVTARAPFTLAAPMLGALWGGEIWISASSAYPVPVRSSTPLPITPSTPAPTPTPSAAATETTTPSPTATGTSAPLPTATGTATPLSTTTATPSPTPAPVPCPATVTIPSVDRNRGYYFTFTTEGTGVISATWTLSPRNNVAINVYSGNPFAGQPNPVSNPPPPGALASARGNVTSLTVTTDPVPPGTYTVYFYNQGIPISGTSTMSVTYMKVCP